MYKQKSVWALGSAIATVIVVSLWSGAGWWCHVALRQAWLAWLLWAGLAAMCICALFFMPSEVIVDDERLTVLFWFRHRDFPLADIKKVEPCRVDNTLARLCGSGVIFGWWGWYLNDQLGKMIVYATNFTNVIFVELANGKKYLISCSDAKLMAEEIRIAMLTGYIG